MANSIAASQQRTNARHTTRTVRGTSMRLVLVPSAPGGPVITFDQHAELLKKGRLTLAEAGALSAVLDDLRAKAAAAALDGPLCGHHSADPTYTSCDDVVCSADCMLRHLQDCAECAADAR